MKRAARLALSGLLLCGCPASSTVPGDLVVGIFDFQATLVEDGCGFLAAGVPGTFSATLSLQTGGERAFLTIGGYSLEGTLAAGSLALESSALRTLQQPCDCELTLSERMEATVVSSGGCPASGEPAPAAPQPDGGLDIRQVCGTIRDEIKPGESCACAPCAAVWTLSGTRQ